MSEDVGEEVKYVVYRIKGQYRFTRLFLSIAMVMTCVGILAIPFTIYILKACFNPWNRGELAIMILLSPGALVLAIAQIIIYGKVKSMLGFIFVPKEKASS